MTLPTVDAWQVWRDSLPPVPPIEDFRTPGCPTHIAMKLALADVQRHHCGICLTTGVRLVMDHEHITGLARGMLCPGCNVREGRRGYDIIVAYRANPPAAGSGWIWDACGSVGYAMLARGRAKAKAEGRRHNGGISCVADSDLALLPSR